MVWPFSRSRKGALVTSLHAVAAGSTAPWQACPQYPPYDGFWRQTGEAPLMLWKAQWDAMGDSEKQHYCTQHAAPEEWVDWLYQRGIYADDEDEEATV